MNMKKKAFGIKKPSALVVALALAVLLAACGGTGSPRTPQTHTTSVATSAFQSASPPTLTARMDTLPWNP